MFQRCVSLIFVLTFLLAPMTGNNPVRVAAASNLNNQACQLFVPKLVSPINGSWTTGKRPYLQFSLPAAFDGWALVEISSHPDFHDPEYGNLDLRNRPSGYVVGFNWWGEVSPNQMYYWRIRMGCRDGSGTGAYTPVWSFYVAGQSNPTVPLFLQKDSRWGGMAYGNYSSSDTKNTIARWGCNLTSAAMLVNYWAEVQGAAFRTDPGLLNTWLRNSGGYDKSNGVSAFKVVEYASANGVAMNINGVIRSRDDALLDAYLAAGIPVIIGVNKQFDSDLNQYYAGHFVVATGKVTENNTQTYTINDPVYGQTTLAARYGNDYFGLRLYSGSGAGGRVARISAHSPVVLLLTDSHGEKIGYDPQNTVTILSNGSYEYLIETIQAADDSGEKLPVSKAIYLNEYEDGPYSLSIIGTGTGEYTIQNTVMDQNRYVSQVQYTGIAQKDEVTQKEFIYLTEIGLVNAQTFLPFTAR